ncbi:MAG TPA: SNF2-related protein, partial [Anaerolineales bacterium]
MSTGRSVTPLRRPGFASVRDLHIPDLVIEALLPRTEIRLAASDGGLAPPLLAGPPFMTDLPIGKMSSSAHPMEAEMVPAALFEGGFSAIAEPVTFGSGPRTPATEGDLSRLVPLFLPPVLPEGGPESSPLEAIRPYQVEAVERLTASTAFLLADDAGTGKSASICLALATLFRGRQARRALVVCPKASRRHWLDELTKLAAGLSVHVARGDRRARDHAWRTEAHVLVVDYQILAEDIARGSLADERLRFDVLVMDQLTSVSRRSALVSDSL